MRKHILYLGIIGIAGVLLLQAAASLTCTATVARDATCVSSSTYAAQSDQYPGAFTWDDEIGKLPKEWENKSREDSPTHVIADHAGHKRVVYMRKGNSAPAEAKITHRWEGSRATGTVEAWVAQNDTGDGDETLFIVGREAEVACQVLLNGTGVHAYNNSHYVHVASTPAGSWIHLQVTFAAKEGQPGGWSLAVNKTEKAENLVFEHAPSELDSITFEAGNGANFNSFLDTVDFSWENAPSLSYYEYAYEYYFPLQFQFPSEYGRWNVKNLDLSVAHVTNESFVEGLVFMYRVYDANWDETLWDPLAVNETWVLEWDADWVAPLWVSAARRVNVTARFTAVAPAAITAEVSLAGEFYRDECNVDCPDCGGDEGKGEDPPPTSPSSADVWTTIGLVGAAAAIALGCVGSKVVK